MWICLLIGILVHAFSSAKYQPRTSYHRDFSKNRTEDNKFEIIPTDRLCEFCVAVIDSLKLQQEKDQNFEHKLRQECENYNGTAAERAKCSLINKDTLSRLKSDSSRNICELQKLCSKPPAATEIPVTHQFSRDKQDSSSKKNVPIRVADRVVHLRLDVEDIAPPYNKM